MNVLHFLPCSKNFHILWYCINCIKFSYQVCLYFFYYSLYTILYEFQMHNIVIQHLYTLQSNHHSTSTICHCTKLLCHYWLYSLFCTLHLHGLFLLQLKVWTSYFSSPFLPISWPLLLNWQSSVGSLYLSLLWISSPIQCVIFCFVDCFIVQKIFGLL